MKLIEWLSDWLKQIVLLVLVATFIDLLLPNKSMERYVKLVMGLLIIMAMLSPIFTLLKKDLNLSSLAFSTKDTPSSKQMEPLDQIEIKSEKLQQTQNQLIEQQTEKSIEQMIRQTLSQKFSVEVMNAKVNIQETPQRKAEIKEIQVIAKVKDVNQPGLAQDSKSVQSIEHIQPVHIQIQETPSVPSSEQRELSTRIQKYLCDTWNLSAGQVQVRIEPTV
jgi:stage III sporulation protein AF